MNNRIERIEGIDYLVVELDAAKATSYKRIFNQLSTSLSFPQTDSSSCGDVLYDFMRDLGWLPNCNIKLKVTNIKKAEKNNEGYSLLSDFLNDIEQYWEKKNKRIGNRFENNFIVMSAR